MNIGIVVEGDRDAAAYPELIRKIRNDIENVLAESCGNDARLKSKSVGWLKHFQWHATYSIHKALVIMDSDCSDPLAWEEQLNRVYERERFVSTFPVHFHSTKCELETWLLADENAVSQVSRDRGKNRQVGAIPSPLESYNDAKELFQKMLSLAGLPVTAPVYREIARCADIERIAARCPHFRQFMDKVRAC